MMQFLCYCEDCRLLNGSHLSGIAFEDKTLEKAEHTQSYSYQGGSGEPIIMHFCPTCATQLYAYPTSYKGMVVIRAGMLGDYDFKPQQKLFPESAFSWDPVK